MSATGSNHVFIYREILTFCFRLNSREDPNNLLKEEMTKKDIKAIKKDIKTSEFCQRGQVLQLLRHTKYEIIPSIVTSRANSSQFWVYLASCACVSVCVQIS